MSLIDLWTFIFHIINERNNFEKRKTQTGTRLKRTSEIELIFKQRHFYWAHWLAEFMSKTFCHFSESSVFLTTIFLQPQTNLTCAFKIPYLLVYTVHPPIFRRIYGLLSAWLLRSHWTLKSILQETLFLDQVHDFSLLSLNSFLQPFLKSKIIWKNSLARK